MLANFIAKDGQHGVSILGVITGSTAVSVIGLIGLVITGLFGRSRS